MRGGWFDYFLALQVGQVAQVALPSVQHFIPQADAASFLAQHLLLLQPATANSAEAHTMTVMSFSVFIYFVFASATPSDNRVVALLSRAMLCKAGLKSM